jgi:hypothetical protein
MLYKLLQCENSILANEHARLYFILSVMASLPGDKRAPQSVSQESDFYVHLHFVSRTLLCSMILACDIAVLSHSHNLTDICDLYSRLNAPNVVYCLAQYNIINRKLNMF